MSRGTPSMVALLGLLAVAGYQNRDKIADMMGGQQQDPEGSNDAIKPQSQGGLLGTLGGLLGGAGAGSVLSGGLRELVDRFKQNGHGQAADSWVSTGTNQDLQTDQLEQAIGPEALNALLKQTGLSREELLSRLTRDLPKSVDRLTPAGRLPTEDEAALLISH